MTEPRYVGRFAPSPSGDLHFGSLIAALGSYLQARANKGTWLVRIEDIDPPREAPGAAYRILTALERYGLYWDNDVVYQSQRHEAYWQALDWLYQRGYCYYCGCSRTQIQQAGRFYSGRCRHRQLGSVNTALRLWQTAPVYTFYDLLRGNQSIERHLAEEDFIIHRRDGLFAYNLAVVVDDRWQGVTQIVRGADLVKPTVRQISLYHYLGWTEPEYMHLPLALNSDGNKLSKQNHAPALPLSQPLSVLAKALTFLGQPLPDDWRDASVDELLSFSINNWNLTNIPQ